MTSSMSGGEIMVSWTKKWLEKYGHGFWIVLYFAFYLVGFSILENASHRHYHLIHSIVDDMIPFCKYFVVPYYLWFAYIAVVILWFVFLCKDKSEYYRMTCALAIGMTVFLVVSCVFPNRQDLRPANLAGTDVFTNLIRYIYNTDTPTNVLPSIHVYNSLICAYAWRKSPQMKKYRPVTIASDILAVLIVLSTMFIKQHSVVDVSCGILMAVAVQMFVDRVFADEPKRAPVRGVADYGNMRR